MHSAVWAGCYGIDLCIPKTPDAGCYDRKIGIPEMDSGERGDRFDIPVGFAVLKPCDRPLSAHLLEQSDLFHE
jgi:hypothetical protein